MQMHREAVTSLILISKDFSYVLHTVGRSVIEYSSYDKAGRVLDHKMCPVGHTGDAGGRTSSQGACNWSGGFAPVTES